MILCPECGEAVRQRQAFINRAIKKGLNIYCSRDCSNKGVARGWASRKLPPWRHRDAERRASRPRPEYCDVCGGRESKGRNGKHMMNFDHNHQTGVFRGWICGQCNRILGLAGDDSTRLRQLAEYLDSHK